MEWKRPGHVNLEPCQGSGVGSIPIGRSILSSTYVVSWAMKWRRNSPPWSGGLNIALAKYRLSEPSLSIQDQPEEYSRLKLKQARIYTELAMGDELIEGQPLVPLKAELADLIQGIEALIQAKGNVDSLKQQRARCYRLIAAFSQDPGDKKK
jgi:hypothetical protein